MTKVRAKHCPRCLLYYTGNHKCRGRTKYVTGNLIWSLNRPTTTGPYWLQMRGNNFIVQVEERTEGLAFVWMNRIIFVDKMHEDYKWAGPIQLPKEPT